MHFLKRRCGCSSWRKLLLRGSWIDSTIGFLPLLHLDTVPKFVQLIKLVQQEIGGPVARVRPPRLDLVGAAREEVIVRTRKSLAQQFH
jgi:hypothetical protein